MAVANELGASYSIAVEEICALVTKGADLAGISIIRTKKIGSRMPLFLSLLSLHVLSVTAVRRGPSPWHGS
jgi:hypothetical protein